MKTSLLVVVLVAFTCGCGRKAADLERRVQKLEEKVTGALDVQRELLSMMSEQNSNSMWGLSNLAILWESHGQAQSDLNDTVTRFMDGEIARIREIAADELERQLQARAAQFKAGVRPAPAPGRPAAEPLKEGVPLSVWNQIAADAAKMWGADFNMQDYEVRKQVEAYKRLNSK